MKSEIQYFFLPSHTLIYASDESTNKVGEDRGDEGPGFRGGGGAFDEKWVVDGGQIGGGGGKKIWILGGGTRKK